MSVSEKERKEERKKILLLLERRLFILQGKRSNKQLDRAVLGSERRALGANGQPALRKLRIKTIFLLSGVGNVPTICFRTCTKWENKGTGRVFWLKRVFILFFSQERTYLCWRPVCEINGCYLLEVYRPGVFQSWWFSPFNRGSERERRICGTDERVR